MESALATQEGGNHYKKMPIQPVLFCEANDLNACQTNVVKYVCRHQDKGGAGDLKKAIHYCDLLLEITRDYALPWERLDIGPNSARRVVIPVREFIEVNRLPFVPAEVVTLLCVHPNPGTVKFARTLILGMLDKHYGKAMT